MYKRLSIVAIAAGAMLLTACGESGSASEDVTAGGVRVDSIAAGDGDEPVDCGEVAITDTVSRNLVADPTTAGIVGCTEAFNVLDDYLREKPLTDGWSCDPEDGEPTYINCVNDSELAFHTQPADMPEPVNCGEVLVPTGSAVVPHDLIADPTPAGIVGCAEAFDVMEAHLDDNPLPDGWTCGADDGEIMMVICAKGEELSFHTQPTDEPLPADTVEAVNCGEVDITETITQSLVADPTSSGVVGCTEAFDVLAEYLAVPVEDRSADLENMPLSDGWACGTDDGEVMSVGCVKGGLDADYHYAFHTEAV